MAEVASTPAPVHQETAPIDEQVSTTAPLLILNHYNKTFIDQEPNRERLLRLLQETATDPDYFYKVPEKSTESKSDNLGAITSDQSESSKTQSVRTKSKEVRIPSINMGTAQVADTDEEIPYTARPTDIVPSKEFRPISEHFSPNTFEELAGESEKHRSYGKTGEGQVNDDMPDYIKEYFKHYKQNALEEIRRAPVRNPSTQSFKNVEVLFFINNTIHFRNSGIS